MPDTQTPSASPAAAPAAPAAPAAAPPSGTSSTPPTAPATTATPATATPAPASTATDAPTPKADTPSATPPADGDKPTQTSEPPAALFKLPEDMKFAPEAVSKFESALKPKLSTEGKAVLSPQEVVDLFVEQARDSYTAWQKQITDQNAANEAECKKRFSPQQLSAAETAMGFLSSFDPTFREVSKQFLNHPTFVNAMRIVGERLTEDTFEIATAPPQPAAKTRAQRMGYDKRTNN